MILSMWHRGLQVIKAETICAPIFAHVFMRTEWHPGTGYACNMCLNCLFHACLPQSTPAYHAGQYVLCFLAVFVLSRRSVPPLGFCYVNTQIYSAVQKSNVWFIHFPVKSALQCNYFSVLDINAGNVLCIKLEKNLQDYIIYLSVLVYSHLCTLLPLQVLGHQSFQSTKSYSCVLPTNVVTKSVNDVMLGGGSVQV